MYSVYSINEKVKKFSIVQKIIFKKEKKTHFLKYKVICTK